VVISLRRAVVFSCGLFVAITIAPGRAESPPVLRVGVVDGSPPCSSRQSGEWQGLAVELWTRIATRERLPFVLSEWPSVQSLLEATGRNEVDVAVGCLNVSPERLGRYRFSLPFQEDGLAVMVLNTPLDLGRAFLASLLGSSLLLLLGGYLLVIGLLTALTWRVEGYAAKPETRSLGWWRSVTKIFQVLATGPGGNTIVATIRGNALVIVAYLTRIVAGSLLVGYLTVNVVREVQGRTRGNITALGDLRGLRVGVRRGTVSESVLREINAGSGGAKVTILPLAGIAKGVDLLLAGSADALLGDNLQLSYLLLQVKGQGSVPTLALQGIRPESQAFALSPQLPEATAARIDQAISALKRNGVVTTLREAATEARKTSAR
jgi:polar amino acid transport system substrate-binding protein